MNCHSRLGKCKGPSGYWHDVTLFWLCNEGPQKLGYFLTCLWFLVFHCEAVLVILENTGAKRDLEIT